MACAICKTRKEKRFCPALHDRICPTCCGAEREVTLDCPSDCLYLQQARRHKGPRDVNELEPAAVFSQVEIPEDISPRHEPLIAALSYVLAQTGRRDRSLHDRDFIEALTALAKRYETLVNSGLIYQHPTANPVQQAISTELENEIAESRRLAERQSGYSPLRDSEVLQVIVLLLRIVLMRTSGRPRSRGFLDFLEDESPLENSLIAGPEESGPRLILP